MLGILVRILGLILICVVIAISKFTSKDAFLGALAGGFIGFIGSWLLIDFSLSLEEKKKSQSKKENTRFIYEMYKMELEQNIGHLRDLIAKRWMPYYRLKCITRNSFWGQLADYSKDIDLFKKLNVVYQEFDLINNKINIMNDLWKEMLLAEGEKVMILQTKYKDQLDGNIGLGTAAIRFAEDCISIINTKILQL